MQGNQEIATSASAVVISYKDWQFFGSRLVQPKSAGGKNLTMSLLTKQDGDYTMVVKAEGEPIKAFPVQVKNGDLQRLDRCRLDYNPHLNFICPRLIDTSSGSGSSYVMLDAYWVEKSK